MERQFFGLAVTGALVLWFLASVPPLIVGFALLNRGRRQLCWPLAIIRFIAALTLKPVVTGAIYIALYLFLKFDAEPARALPALALLGPGVTALIMWSFRGAARAMPRAALALLLALDILRWASAFLATGWVVPQIVAFAMPTLFAVVAWLMVPSGVPEVAGSQLSAGAPASPSASQELRAGSPELRRALIVAMAGAAVLLGPALLAQTLRAISDAVAERRAPGKPLHSLSDQALTTFAWSPDGASIAATGNLDTVYVISAAEDKARFSFKTSPELVDPVAWNYVSWRPQGDVVALQLRPAIQFIDARDGSELRTVRFTVGGGLANAAWSPDGRWLAAIDRDRRRPVLLDPWDAAADRVIGGISGPIGSLAWSTDSRYLAFGLERDVFVWEVAADRLAARIATDVYEPVVGWSPDGAWLSVHGWYGEGVQLWDVASLQRERLPIGQFAKVMSLAWRPDGKQLAVEQEDGTIQIWEPRGAAPVQLLPHAVDTTGQHVDLAWSQNGRWLAAADGANIALWDGRAGELQSLPGHRAHLLTLAWGPAQSQLLTADTSGRVRLLLLAP